MSAYPFVFMYAHSLSPWSIFLYLKLDCGKTRLILCIMIIEEILFKGYKISLVYKQWQLWVLRSNFTSCTLSEQEKQSSSRSDRRLPRSYCKYIYTYVSADKKSVEVDSHLKFLVKFFGIFKYSCEHGLLCNRILWSKHTYAIKIISSRIKVCFSKNLRNSFYFFFPSYQCKVTHPAAVSACEALKANRDSNIKDIF